LHQYNKKLARETKGLLRQVHNAVRLYLKIPSPWIENAFQMDLTYTVVPLIFGSKSLLGIEG
jgi:hypothetical protein